MMQIGSKLEYAFQKIRLSKKFSPIDFYNVLEPVFKKYGYRRGADGVKEFLFISLNAIGDNILYGPFVRELRRNYPQARITAVVTPLTYPLWELCPYVNEVLSLTYTRFDSFADYMPVFLELCQKKLLEHHFEASFCLQWSDDKRPVNLLAYMSGAKLRYGVSDKSILAYNGNFKLLDQWELFLTNPVITPVEIVHEAARGLYVLNAYGGKIANDISELWIGNRDVLTAKAKIRSEKYVVLGIGAGVSNRKYPLDLWCGILRVLYEKFAIPFVICGGGDEKEDGKYIQDNLPPEAVRNLTGELTLRETAAVIQQALFYMGNVTGMMHIAAAAGRPVIALYREGKVRADSPQGIFSELARFAPWKTKAIILQPDEAVGECLHTVVYGGCKETKAHCISSIQPQKVIDAFVQMLKTLSTT